MLNKELFIKELHRTSGALFSGHNSKQLVSSAEWAQLDEVCGLHEHIAQQGKSAGWSLPFSERFTEILTVTKDISFYQVLAIDGSQVYPDRHVAELSCYLLNIGGCYFSYGKTSSVSFFSVPKICTIQENEGLGTVTPDIVDAEREAAEYSMAYEKALELFDVEKPHLLLFDGTLFLWHLEHKAQEIKERFVNHHLAVLQQCKQKNIPVVGYISLTKSKELVRLVKEGLRSFNTDNKLIKELRARLDAREMLNDAQLLQDILLPYERTALFVSASRISYWYPSWLKPCFFYLHTGKEIARIELPAWLAHCPGMLDKVASLCVDQCSKGMGYPVALAEAHEQAVIKSADRDFFYHMIFTMGIAQQHPIIFSQKSIKKRGMSI